MNLDLNKSVLSVRTYQAVMFEGSLSTFFTSKGTSNHKKVDIEIVEGIGALISTEKDAIIVPFPNISIISLKTDHKEKIQQERAEEVSKPAPAQSVSKIKGDPQGAKRF